MTEPMSDDRLLTLVHNANLEPGNFTSAADVRELTLEVWRLRKENANLKEPKTFPILGMGIRIPWSVVEKAFAEYHKLFRGQDMETIAGRGGFGENEMDTFYPAWRDETSEVVALRTEVTNLRRDNQELLDKVASRV